MKTRYFLANIHTGEAKITWFKVKDTRRIYQILIEAVNETLARETAEDFAKSKGWKNVDVWIGETLIQKGL